MNIKAKKSLGQNFLISKEVAKDIIIASNISDTDTVLEIGPGKGFLTEEILKKARRVIAIEKDDNLIKYLAGKFSKELKDGKLSVIHKDILDITGELSDVIQSLPDYKVVANIPYYITGQILRMFLEEIASPSRMVLMLQKEVAERIVARNKKESILSISVKIYGSPKIINIVPAENFNPKPKIDSAILLIENISKKNFDNDNREKEFFKFIKQGFLHKRKTLLGNLKLSEEYSHMDIESVFNDGNIDVKIRAEKLSVKDWLFLQKGTQMKNY